MITFLKVNLIMKEGDCIFLAPKQGSRGGSDRKRCQLHHKEAFLITVGLPQRMREGFGSCKSQSGEPLSVLQ